MPDTGPGREVEHVIAEIISEFSEVFAFARTRWARYAEEVHGDLKGVSMMLLHAVMKKGPITATAIGQALDMDKAVVSRQIAKLRELELVDAEPAPEDRRVVLLTATDLAKQHLDAVRESWAHDYHARFDGWSLDDLERLRHGLERFNEASDEFRLSGGPAARCARQPVESRSQPAD